MFGSTRRHLEDALAENQRLHRRVTQMHVELEHAENERDRLREELRLVNEKSEARAQSWGKGIHPNMINPNQS